MSEFIVAVPARLLSKRIQSKMLLEINGKPVIAHTLDRIHKVVPKEKIHVFCDTEIIQDIVKKYGYNAYLVPDSCENGTERISMGIVRNNIKCEHVLIVHGDQPCLHPENVSAVIDFWKASDKDKDTMYTLHTECDRTIEDTSIAKIAMTNGNKWLYISRSNVPSNYGSQEFGGRPLYKHVSLCMFHVDLLIKYSDMEDTPLQKLEENEWLKLLEHGYTIKSTWVKHNERDLNTRADLLHISRMLKKYNDE